MRSELSGGVAHVRAAMPSYPLTVSGQSYDIDFPYEAYDCQVAMMEKVVESLANNRNALLESPTGASRCVAMRALRELRVLLAPPP